MPEPQLWSLLLSLLVEQQSAVDAEVHRRSDELRRALLHNIPGVIVANVPYHLAR